MERGSVYGPPRGRELEDFPSAVSDSHHPIKATGVVLREGREKLGASCLDLVKASRWGQRISSPTVGLVDIRRRNNQSVRTYQSLGDGGFWGILDTQPCRPGL